MKIWWCQEHECSGVDVSCVYAHWDQAEGLIENPIPCRMVPMRLIPDNALAGIDREALAEALKFNRVDDTEYEFIVRDAARVVLAALDGETP